MATILIPGQPVVVAIVTQQPIAGVMTNYDPHELVVTVSAIEDDLNLAPVVYRFIAGGAQSPAITRSSASSPNAGLGYYFFTWVPSDDGVYSVTVDQLDAGGLSLGATTTAIEISPRPVPIPTP
ncbi:MAG: hypothetical protein ACRDRD_20210 [Pseudonocardiaceae bacterium]